MAELGIDTQVFASQSRLDTWNLPAVFPEQRVRHLDSWLMTPDVSRCCFLQGGMPHDLAVVVGAPSDDRMSAGPNQGGGLLGGSGPHGESSSLDSLCQWLDLPLIFVLNAQSLDPCLLPTPPAPTVAVLLDNCEDSRTLAHWQTCLEARWGFPVIGGICADRTTRQRWHRALEDLNAGTTQGMASTFLDELGGSFAKHVRRDSLLRIAQSASRLCDAPVSWPLLRPRRPVHVAVAYDDAINCYFPDSLEWLEALGARITDFSPLASESVPADADLIWLGCGHPERYAERLARNVCLMESLRSRVRAGARVYAEGGGLALVCSSMRCQAGEFPMAGILPALAQFQANAGHELRPVAFQPVGDPWLGTQPLRGYLHNSWTIRHEESPGGREASVTDFSADSPCPLSLVGDGNVIASCIQLHFASQPQLLNALLAPYAAR
jgi:cobyrinic acid a,c-diamide synthase